MTAADKTNVTVKAYNEIETYSPDSLIRDHSINISQYWIVKGANYPTLSKLAQIVNVVPATQASVVRNFSILKWMLADKRNQLSSNNLESILIVKLNTNY